MQQATSVFAYCLATMSYGSPSKDKKVVLLIPAEDHFAATGLGDLAVEVRFSIVRPV